MEDSAKFNATQPTLNPSWKEALDKAMHQSLMRGRSIGMEKKQRNAIGKRNKREDDSVTLSDNDDDSRDDDDELSSSGEDDDYSDPPPAHTAHTAPASFSRAPPPPPPPAYSSRPSNGNLPSVLYANPGETAESVKARLEQNRNLQREEKMELLGRLHYFMDEKGFRPFKVLGPEDSLEDIRYEVFRAQRELSKKRNVKFMQKALVSAGAGLEMANSMYNPLGLRLDGFSKSLLLSIKDYDEIFEELHWKYCDTVSMPPELRLVMTLGSSIFFYHLSNNGAPSRNGERPGPGAMPMSPPRMDPRAAAAQPASQRPMQPPMQPPMQRKMAGPRARMGGEVSSSSGPNVDMSTLMSGLSMVNTLINNT